MTEPTQRVSLNLAFTGPIERVFDAWLDPDVAGHWLFATRDGRMVKAEIDPKVDGAFTMTERRGGQDVEHRGRYLVINRPSRLSFTFSVTNVSDRDTQVDVSLMPVGEWVILGLTQHDVPAALAEATEQGWSDMLDRLAARLEATAPAGPVP